MVYKLPKDAIGSDLDADNISANLISSWVPLNGIIMYHGTIAEAEALTNWQICDGANGSPDLRDKFVLGVGSTANPGSYSWKDEGGSKDAVVVEHKHSITDPGHDHDIEVVTDAGSGNNSIVDENSNNSNGVTDTTGVKSNTTGITETQDNGVDGTDANLPPYFALIYLMRTV